MLINVDSDRHSSQELRIEHLPTVFAKLDASLESRKDLRHFLSTAAQILKRTVGARRHETRYGATPDGEVLIFEAGNEFRISEDEHEAWFSPEFQDPVIANLLTQRIIHGLRMIPIYSSVGQNEAAQRATNDLRALLSRHSSSATRSRSAARLGLAETQHVRALAIVGESPELPRFIERLTGRQNPVTARMGHATVALQTTVAPIDVDVPVGIAVGIGDQYTATTAHLSLDGALIAARFTKRSTHSLRPYTLQEAVIVDLADIGVFQVLAQNLDPDMLSRVPEISAVRQLVEEEGQEAFEVLEAVAAHSSIRRAAAQVHLHHNTVASRVTAAESRFGFSFSEPYGRSRLLISLTLFRLSTASSLR